MLTTQPSEIYDPFNPETWGETGTDRLVEMRGKVIYPGGQKRLTLAEAFAGQIEKTRLLIQEDFEDDENGDPVVWNGVIIRPNGNNYSSGKEMVAGDKLLVGYIVADKQTPRHVLIEEKELDFYEDKFSVIRVVDNVPVMEKK